MSKDRNYKVYVHINKTNGKRYYGITKQKVERRWNSGKGYSYNEYFTRAINKYGWDNFEHIVIAKGLTEEDAKWLEIELIREWDTTNPEYGYNITKGGESFNGYKHTEEHRRKISEANKGREVSEETRKKLSESHKGHKPTEETRKKLSEAHKGKGGTKIYCVELEQYFDTITEASEYLNYSVSSISAVLTKNNKTAGDYHWLYAEDVNKENINKVLSKEYNTKVINNPNATKVYCVELEQYFDSIKKASEYVGCNRSYISKVLGKSNRTCGGYHWIYAEDVEIENNKVS